MPFITEDIWQRVSKLTSEGGETIMLSSYPTVTEEFSNPVIEQEIDWLKSVIQAVRNIRGEMNIAPSKSIPLYLAKLDNSDKTNLEKYLDLITSLAKISTITVLHTEDEQPVSATALVGQMEVLIPMADLIDKQAEITRLKKEIAKISKEIDKSTTKLGNPSFTEKAPAIVIDKEKERLSAASKAKEQLCNQLTTIEKL